MFRGFITAVLAVVCAGLAATPACGAPLGPALDRYMAAAGPGSGAVAYDAETGGLLYAKRSRTPRVLASNTKLFTTAAALGRLGAATTLQTSVLAAGTIDGTTLRGDLYLRGGGDPALSTELYASRYAHGLLTDVDALAQAVRATGLRRISGRIYADDSIFDRIRGVPATGFRVSSDLAPLSGLVVNGGFTGDRQRRYAPDPAVEAAGRLRFALSTHGVRTTGGVRLRPVSSASEPAPTPLVSTDSPPLASLVRQTNTFSDNFYAEMLLKRLAAGNGHRGTTSAGAGIAESFARHKGSRANLADGSGLTRSDRASPRAVARLLLAMWHGDQATPFVESLAQAGRTGTLADRMRHTAAAGRCLAKTGTLIGVSALSGYCQARSGREVAFSILMNGINVYTARRLQNRILVALVKRA